MDGPSPTDARAGGSRGERLALLALWVPYAALVWRFRFVTDDAFITFRYSRNLALGNGPVFNPGVEPPVEGYSNFLWMLVGALFERLGVDVAAGACLLSFACGSLLLHRLFRALRVHLGLALLPAWLATALLALHPPFVVWSTGGLATVPYALLLFVSFELLCLGSPRSRRAAIGTGLVLVALAWIRVEGGLWALAFLGLALLLPDEREEPIAARARRLAPAALVLIAGFGAWWLWRTATYDAPVPNTLVAKAGFGLVRLLRGLDYVLANELAMLTPLLLLPATVLALRRGRRPVGSRVALAAWSFPLWSIAVGGDYMTMGRFLVPGAAFVFLLSGWLLKPLLDRSAVLGGAIASLLVLAGLLPAFDRSVVPESVLARFDFRSTGDMEEEGDASGGRFVTEHRQWLNQRANACRWAELGVAMRHWLPAEASFVAATIGASGYYSGLFVHDRHGLVTAEVARREIDPEKRRLAGHEKGVPLEFFLPLEPDVLLAGVTSGLPNHHLGWEESRSREFFVERFRRFYFRAAQGRGIEDRYVPELHPVPADRSIEVRPVLAYLRRLAPGEDAAAAWSDVEARLGRIVTGEDPLTADPSIDYPPRPLGWVPRVP